MTWLLTIAAVIVCSTFTHAQESETADPRALDQFIKGNAAAQQGNPYQAIYFFEEAIRFDPEAPFLQVALAEQYLILAEENNSSEAIARAEEALANALSQDPEHTPALELKARLLAAQGKTGEAIQIVRKLLAKEPTSKYYQVDLLGLSLSTGEFDTVDSLYQILNPLEDADLDMTRRVVAIFLVSGESARAIPYLKRLLDADSTDSGIVYTLATLYLQTNDTLKAVESVNQALALDSTDTRYWYLKLVIDFERERYTDVLELAKLARSAAGEDAKSSNLEGLCYMRLADSTNAKDRFLKALELDSTLYPAAGSLALLYDAEDSVEKSERFYNTAIQLSDSAAIYMNNCAYMYAVRGLQLVKAMYLVDRALEKDPENPSYLDTKGWVHYQQAEHKEALKWIKKALKYDPKSPALLEHLGDVYFAMGKSGLAKQHWEDALELTPNSMAIKEKLAR